MLESRLGYCRRRASRTLLPTAVVGMSFVGRSLLAAGSVVVPVALAVLRLAAHALQLAHSCHTFYE